MRPVSEVKSIPISDFELKQDGEVVVAFAKYNEIDHDKDVTYPGAFPEGKTVPMSAYGHTSWPHRGSALPPGKGIISDDAGVRAVFRGAFFLKTTSGRDTYETVKEMGDQQEWSYGYDVKDFEPKPKNFPGAKRGLKSVDPYEVSPVLLGAGLSTQTLAIKELDGDVDLLVGSFTEQADRVLAACKALHVREEDIIDLRLKEGRAISSDRRKRLEEQRDVLRSLLEGHEALLAETEPKPKDGEAGDETKGRGMLLKARAELDLALAQRGYRV